jgi:hypothetical protein
MQAHSTNSHECLARHEQQRPPSTLRASMHGHHSASTHAFTHGQRDPHACHHVMWPSSTPCAPCTHTSFMGASTLHPDTHHACTSLSQVYPTVSSIVKELVENALDAGGKSVEISIVGAGLESITVSDNGVGISPESAGVCTSALTHRHTHTHTHTRARTHTHTHTHTHTQNLTCHLTSVAHSSHATMKHQRAARNVTTIGARTRCCGHHCHYQLNCPTGTAPIIL